MDGPRCLTRVVLDVHVLACPDKFKGSASAPEVAAAIDTSVRAAGSSCTVRPLADGGEGTLDAFGGPNRTTTVTGPLGAPVEARWRLDGDTAVMEAAQACGLVLAGGAQGNDPLGATTSGVGELLAIAIRSGARSVLVGVGGSATTDGGAGAVAALRAAGLGLENVRVTVCCDVRTPFTEAAQVFAPQKGATPEQVRSLSERLRSARDLMLETTGIDVDELAGSGAAGGLAGGLAMLGAQLVPGFDAIADHVGLDAAIAAVDLVVTGEGRVDTTSLDGKVVGGVVARAGASGVPVIVVCGTCTIDLAVPVLDLTGRFGPQRSWGDTARCVTEIVDEWLHR
ncbi:MAG TPA: glycerate kinase [Jatrophihabitans sp.]|jgi:glycerate kinase